MISVCISDRMCQPVKGHLVRSTRIPQNVDHAHSPSNCAEARTYIFGGNDVSGDELCREDVQLVRQYSKSSSDGERRRRSMVTFAEAPLHSGDTLVTIALKYGCRVSELKQLNRLISDQEVYGLRTIRVPVKRYGLVEELIRAEMDKEQSNVKLGVVEVSSSETSDNEMADDDGNENASSNSPRHPLLQHAETDTRDANHLSKQARRALKHLHAVDSNVRTVVSAVASSRTFRRSANNRVVTYARRQESMQSVWRRMRWWVVIVGTTFIVLPLMILLYMKFIRTAS